MAITKYLIGAVLGLIGLFYALLPHSVHVNSGIGFGLSHAVHVIIGLILIVAAIVVIVIAKRG